MAAAEIALAAASAAIGGVQVGQTVAAGGGFSLTSQGASYPREIVDFLPQQHYLDHDVIKFFGNGYVWNTELQIAMHGYFSNTVDDLLCFEDHPGIPSNRYMKDVAFYKGVNSDSVSNSLLECNIVPEQAVGGDATLPHLIFHVDGHFDPVGFGDSRFSFRLIMDTFAAVWYDNVQTSDNLKVSMQDGAVLCFLDQ